MHAVLGREASFALVDLPRVLGALNAAVTCLTLAHVEVGADRTSSFCVGVGAVMVLVLLGLLVLGSSPPCLP